VTLTVNVPTFEDLTRRAVNFVCKFVKKSDVVSVVTQVLPSYENSPVPDATLTVILSCSVD